MPHQEHVNDEEPESSAEATGRKERKIKKRVVKAKTSAASATANIDSQGAANILEKALPGELEVVHDGAPMALQSESCPELDAMSLDVPREPVKGVICSHCDTEVDLSTSACPICGTPLDFHDNGLVRLFSDMEFEDDCSGEIDCPLCGDRVVLQDGSCPSCLELVHAPDGFECSEKLEPVVSAENVVFVHLDVEHGELACLQRTPHRLGLEHVTVKLED